jgi:hypothetical protein
MAILELNTDNLSDLSIASMNKLLMLIRNGGTVDAFVRKDGKETRVEADWLKYIKPKQP